MQKQDMSTEMQHRLFHLLLSKKLWLWIRNVYGRW